jgi:hypothetical protein
MTVGDSSLGKGFRRQRGATLAAAVQSVHPRYTRYMAGRCTVETLASPGFRLKKSHGTAGTAKKGGVPL